MTTASPRPSALPTLESLGMGLEASHIPGKCANINHSQKGRHGSHPILKLVTRRFGEVNDFPNPTA